MKLHELLIMSEPGTEAGTCYLCGCDTDVGWREVPSDSFTAWASCYGGDVQCPGCHAMLKDKRFRMYTWLATPANLMIADAGNRAWVWRTLCSPPEPPFALYITQGGQKQGWIGLVNYVSESRQSFAVGTDWTDRPVNLRLAWITERAAMLDRLRGHKIPKAVISGGVVWSMSHLRRLDDDGLLDDYETARALAGDPRWEVMVHAHS